MFHDEKDIAALEGASLNGMVAAEYVFCCKHGRGPCPRCGTSPDDAAHPTRGGKGLVARLREKQR